MTLDQIDISVCICTRNRPDDLCRALDSIADSNYAPKQVVVSDDSDDGLIAVIAAGHYPSLTYTRGPRLGLGANRNQALSVTSGDYVVFLDDDARLGRDFLSTMALQLSRLTPERRARTIITGAETQDGRSIVPRDQGFLGFQSRRYRPGEPLRTVVINATIFPTALFLKVQFDPQLRYGYDEVDVTTQAVAHGFEIVPCYEATNDHRPSPINRDEYRPYTDASRLYVTLKRRQFTENAPLRAWIGFVAAICHLYLAAVKRNGLRGIPQASQATSYAFNFYRQLQDGSKNSPNHKPQA